MIKKKLCFIFLFLFLHLFLFSEKYTIFRCNGKYGLIDMHLNIVINPIYDNILAKADDFFIAVIFSNSSYVSYIIKDLQVIYCEENQHFEQIYKNFFVKTISEKYNRTGKILFDCFTGKEIYNDWGIYKSDSPIIPVRGENFWYYVDNQGNKLEKLNRYEKVFGFYENTAVVMLDDRKYIVIDRNGNKKFSYKMKDCYQRYSEGLMAAVIDDKNSGFIDYDGVMKIPRTFYYMDGEFAITEFSNGFACVKSSEKDQKWDIIDRKGDYVASFFSADIPSKFCNGFCLTTTIQQNRKRWGFISTTGTLLANRYFDGGHEFLNGWATIIINGKDALINTHGEIIFVSSLYD